MVAGEMPKSKNTVAKSAKEKIKACNVNNINGDNIDNTTAERTHTCTSSRYETVRGIPQTAHHRSDPA